MFYRLRACIGILSILTIIGCASTDTKYTGPTGHKVENEKIVPAGFEATWRSYVEELSKSFFVINNISKDSGIINVSYSTGTPGDFIDCGYTRRETKHPRLGSKVYSYEVANDSNYLYGVKGTNILWEVTRRTKLSGRANISYSVQR